MSRIYFKNLDALRFIAAFVVIIHHLEQLKASYFNIESYWHIPFVRIVGKLGVILFFVLSGFLITYLLLVEKERHKNISVIKFYIRRILRIWPLFFLITFFGFFIAPRIGVLQFGYDYSSGMNIKLLLYIFLMPNVALALGAAVPYISHMWSIGTEEQFYLFWPILMKRAKNFYKLMFKVIGFYLIIKFVIYFLNYLYPNLWYLHSAKVLWDHTTIDCMAIGGLAAVVLYEKDIRSKIIAFFFSLPVQIITILSIIVLISIGFVVPFFHYEFYAILFAILILNLAGNPENILRLENRVLNYLGKISYGIYVYHVLGIILTLLSLNYFGIYNPFLQLLFSTLTTIAIASLSFELYEKYFIKKKDRFSMILSGKGK